jgi:hypothetical protein
MIATLASGNHSYGETGARARLLCAIDFFGNAGCTHDNEASIPFTVSERDLIARIVPREQSLSCRE